MGVARQYSGRLGKTDNCQVAVSLSLANLHGSLHSIGKLLSFWEGKMYWCKI